MGVGEEPEPMVMEAVASGCCLFGWVPASVAGVTGVWSGACPWLTSDPQWLWSSDTDPWEANSEVGWISETWGPSLSTPCCVAMLMWPGPRRVQAAWVILFPEISIWGRNHGSCSVRFTYSIPQLREGHRLTALPTASAPTTPSTSL